MSNSISVSEKHGVNPSMLVCPVCKEGVSIALMGKLPNDKEAPRQMEGSELCDKCKETHLEIVEWDKKKDKGTGRVGFILRESLNPKLEMYDDVLKAGGVLMNITEFTQLMEGTKDD